MVGLAPLDPLYESRDHHEKDQDSGRNAGLCDGDARVKVDHLVEGLDVEPRSAVLRRPLECIPGEPPELTLEPVFRRDCLSELRRCRYCVRQLQACVRVAPEELQ